MWNFAKYYSLNVIISDLKFCEYYCLGVIMLSAIFWESFYLGGIRWWRGYNTSQKNNILYNASLKINILFNASQIFNILCKASQKFNILHFASKLMTLPVWPWHNLIFLHVFLNPTYRYVFAIASPGGEFSWHIYIYLSRIYL
jgi:hypothetical protein